MHVRRRPPFSLATVLVAVAFFAVNAAAAETSTAESQWVPPGEEVVEFLLSTAASEFKTPGQVNAVDFRSVRVGYFSDAPPGRYVLCGSVQSSGPDKTEWIRFATIQTSPYEQWLGGVAESICGSKKVKWYTGDLSPELLRRVRG
jgi:hypothetical protein